VDQNQVTTFSDWGMRRPFVPQLFFIDKNGAIKAQFMGTDDVFVGDQKAKLRAEIVKQFGLKTAPPAPPAVRKK
jgi:roadblock/LC7 domain-containing protein